jgi:SAM-dependent methyltransferase
MSPPCPLEPKLQADQAVVIARCPLCSSTAFAPYAEFPQFTWVRCDCGLIYKRAAIAASFEVGGAGAFGEQGYGQRYKAQNSRRVGKSLRQIRDALEFVDLPALTEAPRLLDVGCSLGYTLLAGRQLGLDACGVDVSEVAAAHCRELGFDCRVAGLEAVPFPARHFAVVTMKHVLEHTATPREALREARRILHPQGALFIAVPHAGYRKALRDPRASRFYRPDAHGGVEHWVYYTPATLSRLLESEGFTVRRVHPLLIHGARPAAALLGEWLTWPARAAAGRLRTALGLRKEFWLVARP